MENLTYGKTRRITLEYVRRGTESLGLSREPGRIGETTLVDRYSVSHRQNNSLVDTVIMSQAQVHWE